jgi:nucleoside-diphosphate-sugar epimerase
MRIFLAGATGVVGRPLLTKLVDDGHEVTAITRSKDRAAHLAGPNVRAVVADVYDQDAVRRAMMEAKPDVVVHQMTALPARLRPKKVNVDSFATNRLRTKGTQILIEAAIDAGARRFIAQSIAFVTRPEGPPVLDESAPLYDDAPAAMRDFITAVAELERRVTSAPGIDGVVLRYGFFYGPKTAYAPDGWALADVARGRLPIVGEGAGMWSFVHVDDAALATVRALHHGRGIYNIADDDPAPAREWITELAARCHKRAIRIPAWLARLIAGPYGIYLMTQLRGASNAKAKRELGWAPMFPTWRGKLGT